MHFSFVSYVSMTFFYFGGKLFRERVPETKKDKMCGITNEVKRKMFLSSSPQESQYLNSPGLLNLLTQAVLQVNNNKINIQLYIRKAS